MFHANTLPLHSHCGISSVGRALASQAEGRGFESRIPLHPLTPPYLLKLSNDKKKSNYL